MTIECVILKSFSKGNNDKSSSRATTFTTFLATPKKKNTKTRTNRFSAQSNKLKTIDDPGEDPSTFWGKVASAHVKPFAEQYYSPDYIEDYSWDDFDPSFANKLDLTFAALPIDEQFLRLPKGIVENTHNYLSERNVAAMLTWKGDHGKAGNWDYLKAVADRQGRAWSIAKRFINCLKRMRMNLECKMAQE